MISKFTGITHFVNEAFNKIGDILLSFLASEKTVQLSKIDYHSWFNGIVGLLEIEVAIMSLALAMQMIVSTIWKHESSYHCHNCSIH